MNIQSSYHPTYHDSKYCQVIKSRNDLQITRIDCLMDTRQSLLTIFLESDLLSGQEVNAFMQGLNLVIEAPRLLEYEGPIKRHLVDYRSVSDSGSEIYQIGFSEVSLDRGFSYGIMSSRMITPGLLKIVLSFKRLRKIK